METDEVKRWAGTDKVHAPKKKPRRTILWRRQSFTTGGAGTGGGAYPMGCWKPFVDENAHKRRCFLCANWRCCFQKKQLALGVLLFLNAALSPPNVVLFLKCGAVFQRAVVVLPMAAVVVLLL